MRHPTIRYGVLIGAGAKILGNIEVGHCAKVAAGSVVLANVPHNKTVAGVPARVVGETGCDQPSRMMDQHLPGSVSDHIATYDIAPSESVKEQALKPEEIRKLDAYFKRLFQNPRLEVKARPRKEDSAELYLGDEFLGLIYKDEEDGDYNFQMAILDMDL